jgi:pimeloyl-ACP methyl ester carboxylesterase
MRGVAPTLLLVACVATGARSAPQPRISLQPCDVADIAGGGQCGTLEVYENRPAATGRKISLNVVVIPALSAAPARQAVFWLEGGPGFAATQSIGPVSEQYLKGLRADRDLVFVDQRGTGKSNPLKCDDIGETPANLDRYFGSLFPRALIRACREKLEKVADLTRYTTSIAMDDLDDVHDALGYERIDLAGASYGTLSAQVYMRQHPTRVRAAFLVGVVTPDFRLPLPFARATQNAFDLMLVDCAADRVCHDAFPRLKHEFGAVLARFDRGPMVVKMLDAATQQTRSVRLERENYVEHLRPMLYSTAGAGSVPFVVHRAFEGDFLPFQTMATRFNLGGPGAARGMYFSATCAESIPFITEQEIVAETRGTFLGDRRLRAHIAACQEWPKGEVPRNFADPIRSDVPVVMFSGDADGSTPPWIAEAGVKFLRNGRQIKAPHTGHQIDGPCTWDLMQAFFKNPDVQRLDASCVAQAHRPPFATSEAPARPVPQATSPARVDCASLPGLQIPGVRITEALTVTAPRGGCRHDDDERGHASERRWM